MLTLGKKKTTDKENKSSNQPAKEEGQTDGELETNFPSVLHNFYLSNFKYFSADVSLRLVWKSVLKSTEKLLEHKLCKTLFWLIERTIIVIST